MALAERHRTVVSVVGDGTFLYYPQILYSAVNVNARVLYLVVNNRAYHILKTGLMAMKNLGAPVDAGPLECLDLHGPADIVKIAESFGVPAERVSALDELTASLKRGLAADGPYLIDMIIKEK
jgi:benzoylformate decarboxylase